MQSFAGKNGRRHEVDFEGADITVEVFFGRDAVEIAVEPPHDPTPSGKQRFALLNVPRGLFKRLWAKRRAARRARARRS